MGPVTEQSRQLAGEMRDQLNARLESLNSEIALKEQLSREKLAADIDDLRRTSARDLAATLAPIERDVADTLAGLYAQERLLGALPAAPASFSQHQPDEELGRGSDSAGKDAEPDTQAA